jgi:hypothetical protein
MINFILTLWYLCLRARDKSKIPEGSEWFVSDDDTAFIWKKGEKAYIIVDGTHTWREWLENFLVFPFGRKMSFIGFDNAAKDFYEQMIKNSKILESTNELIFSGWSRGGAITQLLGDRFFDAGRVKQKTYTFGSPKLGRLTYWLSSIGRGKHHCRVFFPNDKVTWVPFSGKHYQTEKVRLKTKRKKVHSSYGSELEILV